MGALAEEGEGGAGDVGEAVFEPAFAEDFFFGFRFEDAEVVVAACDGEDVEECLFTVVLDIALE